MNVPEIIERNSLAFHDKVALVDESGARLTWQELNEGANRFGNVLLRIGLRKGDRLGIILENSCEYLVSILGAARVGVITAGISNKLKTDQIGELINNCTPHALLVQDKFSSIIGNLRHQMETVEAIIGLGKNHSFPNDYIDLMAKSSPLSPDIMIEDDDIFILQYTSGTTSLPKGAIITHRSAFARMMMLYMGFRLGRDEVFLNGFPLYGGAGLMIAMGGLFSGCTLVAHTLKGKSWAELIERERVTTQLMNVTRLKIITDFLAEGGRKYDFSSLRKMEIGGMGLSASQFRHISQYFNVPGRSLYSWYGSSEAGVPVLLLTPEEIIPSLESPTGSLLERRLESIGKATPFVALRVVDEEGQDVKPGETGEIIMRGDSLMKGYWNRPDVNEKAFRDGWYYSNDYATKDEDGFFYFVGRKDNLIRSAGFFINPTEVERIISKHPAIEEAAVFGMPHETWGEIVTAACTLKPGHALDEEFLKQYCRENMARYEIPRNIRFMNVLPKDPASGKILVRELISLFTCEV